MTQKSCFGCLFTLFFVVIASLLWLQLAAESTQVGLLGVHVFQFVLLLIASGLLAFYLTLFTQRFMSSGGQHDW